MHKKRLDDDVPIEQYTQDLYAQRVLDVNDTKLLDDIDLNNLKCTQCVQCTVYTPSERERERDAHTFEIELYKLKV